jgi:hypothetical protein
MMAVSILLLVGVIRREIQENREIQEIAQWQ